MQVHGAMLALHTNRPVKIVYNREESFTGHVHRHPARIWCEHRATREGRLVNVRMRILLDGGAYASSLDRGHVERRVVRGRPVRVAERADRVDRRLHEQPAVRRDARLRRRADVLRQRGADGQARGRARHRPDRAAAAERARARRRAADRAADHAARCRSPRRSAPPPRSSRRRRSRCRATCSACRAAPGNTTNGEGVRRGVGFAVGFKNIAYSEGFDDYCAARVRLLADGSAEVHCAAAEVGQGVTGVILQVARTELGLDDVRLAPGQTATVDSAGSASASRMTWMAAGAVRDACRAALEEQARRPGEEIDVEQHLPASAHDAARPGDGPDHRRARARRVRGVRDEGRRRGRRRPRA